MSPLLPLQATAGGAPELPTVLLSSITWVPAIAGIILLLIPVRTEAHRGRPRTAALTATGLVLLLALAMWYSFRDQGGVFAFEETRNWIPAIKVSYHLGVDGVSMPLVLLSTVLFFVASLAAVRVRDRPRAFFALLLFAETGINGTLCALDYLLFFLFWEMTLLPLFFLLARWGGAARVQAAWKFLGFNLAGSALLLLAILITAASGKTFDVVTLHDAAAQPPLIAGLAFWLSLLAFAIRLPIFPLHGWFVDSQAEASPPVGMILAGIFVTLGGYGLYRVNLGEFQEVMHRVAVPLVAGAVFSIFWGALRAFTEADLKRVIGFATLSRMGLVVVAVVSAKPVALNGGVLLMLASGLAAALLVLLASIVLERTGTVSLRSLGGLGARMPRTGILFALGSLAMLGIPGLAAFAAQVMIFFGAYPVQRLAVSFAILMGLLWAGLLIWIAERIFLGATPERFIRLRDAGTLELTCTVTLAGLSVILGVFPALITDSISFGVLTLLTRGGG